MATSPSVCSVPRAASPSLQTETKPWPCYSAAQTKPWPSCSPASTRPSTKLLWKISTRTKSTRPPDILLNLASVHFLPSWTLEITHILSQYGLLRTLTDQKPEGRFQNRWRWTESKPQNQSKQLANVTAPSSMGRTEFLT